MFLSCPNLLRRYSRMSKRSLASAPASPSRPKKKAKLAPTPGQSRLESFFGASSNITPNSAGPSQPSGSKSKASTSPAPAHQPNLKNTLTDEEVAWALAAADGLDLEALRQLESRGSSAHLPGAPARHESTQSEVIDVDAFSDENSSVKPSTSRRAKPAPRAPSTVERSSDAPRSPAPARIQHTTIGNAPASESPTYEPLNVDPPAYDLDWAPWPPNAPVPYSFLAHTLATLSGTRSRIAKLDTLTNALRTICRQHPPSLLPALYLLSNSLSPPYSPIELGLGPSIISKAIQHVSGLSSAALKRLYNQTGDPGKLQAIPDNRALTRCVFQPGDVAFEAKSNVRTLIPHPPLLIIGVYDSLLRIAHAKGSGAAKTKQAIVEKLLVAARGEETRFLVRTLGQNLRVGAVRTALAALARAMVLTPPPNVTAPIPSDSPFRVSAETLAGVKPLTAKKKVADEARDELNEVYTVAESLLKRVYVQHPNYDHIVKALLEVGLDGLAQQLPLTVGESRPRLRCALRVSCRQYSCRRTLASDARITHPLSR